MDLLGPNWPCMIKISSSGIEIVLTCIIHDYKSYWPTQGSFRHPWGTFWPQKALLGVPEELGGSWFGPNCRQLVWLNHGYQTLWPGLWPLLGPQGSQRACFGPKCPKCTKLDHLGAKGTKYYEKIGPIAFWPGVGFGVKIPYSMKMVFLMVVWDFSLHSWVELN